MPQGAFTLISSFSSTNRPLNHIVVSRARLAICVQLLAMLCLLGLAWAGLLLNTHPEILIRRVSYLQIALIIWIFCSWKWVTGTLFDPYMLFVLAAVMFHAAQQLLECLNLTQGPFLFGLFPPEISLQAILLVLLSFALLHLGALIAVAGFRTSPLAESRRAFLKRNYKSDDLLLLGWMLFAASAVPAALMLRQVVADTMSGGYFFALFAHQGATGFAGARNFLASFLIPSLLFLLAGSANRKAFPRILSAAFLLLYCAAFLFVGSRTVAAVSLAVYAWLWDRLVYRIPRTLIAVTLLIGVLVVFPLIALTRNTSGGTRLSWDYLEESWSSLNRPAASSLAETGGSLATVAYTIELVPSVRDFDLGLSYLFAASTVFPNLFWDKHPAVAHGTPGDWMMNVIDPDTAAAGGGLGYSFIAESYFNFGWAGPLLIGILGFFIGRLTCKATCYSDPLLCACVANVLMPLLWASRNDAAGAAREVLWLGVGPYVLFGLIARIRNRSGPVASEEHRA